MSSRSSRHARLGNVLEQLVAAKRVEIMRVKARIAELRAQQRDIERILEDGSHVVELTLGSTAVRLARIGAQAISAEQLLARLNEVAVEIGRKRKLVEKRRAAAVAEEAGEAARRDLEELASWLESTSLRQG